MNVVALIERSSRYMAEYHVDGVIPVGFPLVPVTVLRATNPSGRSNNDHP